MNIYVVSFRQAPEIAKYIVDVNEEAHGLFYWQEWYISEGVTEIKAGDVIKVINTNPNLPYETKKMYPAYIIARMDHVVTDPGEPNDNEALMIPLEFENDDEYATNRWVNVIGRNGYPNYDVNIWETCTPNNGYANEVPWSFITEGVITDYISFQWNDKYYEPGSFSLALPANDENMTIFQEGRYILNEESEHVMMIETVQFNSNLKSDGYIMTVSGRSIEAILERRIAFPGQGLNTNEYKGEDGMRKAIYDLITNFFITPENIAAESPDGTKSFYYPERRVPFIELPNGNNGAETKDSYIKRPFRASVNQTVSKDDLLKVIGELCKNSNLGFKILATPRFGNSRCITWKPVLYTGEDKSYSRSDKTKPLLLFSPTVGNVEAIATTKDITNYRNAVFCGVEKESDGYINLTTNATEANYFAQKTGVEIIDSFNSNATRILTGVKETLVSKLEPSPVCYTGILFLAIAASRKDKDYTATVTKIVSGNSNPFFSTSITAGGTDPIVENAVGYMDAYKTYSGGQLGDFISLPVVTEYVSAKSTVSYNTPDINYKNTLITIPQNGTELDTVYFSWHGTVYEVGIEYFYSQNKAYGILRPRRMSQGTEVATIPIFDSMYYEGVSGTPVSRTQIAELKVTVSQLQSETILAYPTDYITKEQAENITITYRMAFGDVGDYTSSSKTGTFRLCDVNNAVAPSGNMSFKESTAAGWLTIPILKQATADLNNTTFSRLSMLKKSAIQGWFKAFDKYTSGQTQMRWLCQDYISDANQVGIDRREVFVEEDNSDSTDWNASKINQFQSSTVTISTDEEEDEESDEVINERLMASARKRSGDYRKKRDIDASLELENYKYRSPEANGYDLGDIIQVDDGWGNLDQFIITGYTISIDTTSGPKRVPTFERYEPLPKAYRQLDYLQVANMILPAKFNPRYSGAANATELNLPANVYFGALDSNKTYETIQNEQLEGLTRIWSESQGKITDIEANLQYIQKVNINEESEPLSNIFAMISAIGSQDRTKGIATRINIPFCLLSTTLKSPFLFMTPNSNAETSMGTTRYIYSYVGNSAGSSSEENVYIFNYGMGYKNAWVPSDVSSGFININNLDNYIYRASDDGNEHLFVINKLTSGHPKYYLDDGTGGNRAEFADKTMYYANCYMDNNDNILFNRSLSRVYYIGLLTYGELTNRKWLVDSSCIINTNSGSIIDNNYNRRFMSKLDAGLYYSGITAPLSSHNFDSTYWGQDNYRYPTFYAGVDDDYEDFQYENHIVLGGLGYYWYKEDPTGSDYKIRFDNYDAGGQSIYGYLSPRAGDTNNGVRVFEVKIYETDTATRYTQFGASTEHIDSGSTSETRIYKTYGDARNDSSHSSMFDSGYDLAFYPDLTTRKLVHDYVPVVYLEGGDDILDTEKYGLFDLINQQFVPINFGDNEDATFIEAGGEIARE